MATDKKQELHRNKRTRKETNNEGAWKADTYIFFCIVTDVREKNIIIYGT